MELDNSNDRLLIYVATCCV